MKYKGIWITILLLFALGIVVCIVGGFMGAFDIIENADDIKNGVVEFVESFIPERNDKPDTILTANTTDLTGIELKLDNFNVKLRSTSKAAPEIEYKDSAEYSIELEYDEQTLIINGTNNKAIFSNPEVTVYIPDSYTVKVDTENTALNVKNIIAESFTCSTSNAAISFENVTVGLDIKIDSDNSAVSLDSVKCKTGDVVVSTDNAVISCDEVSCYTLSLSTNTALCSVEDIIASNIIINTDTGIVDFSSIEAENLNITTDTGNVTGEVEGPKELYTTTITANNKTTKDGSGSKTINISTDTGIVRIEYDR